VGATGIEEEEEEEEEKEEEEEEAEEGWPVATSFGNFALCVTLPLIIFLLRVLSSEGTFQDDCDSNGRTGDLK
jgi:hypothetical protein